MEEEEESKNVAEIVSIAEALSVCFFIIILIA